MHVQQAFVKRTPWHSLPEGRESNNDALLDGYVSLSAQRLFSRDANQPTHSPIPNPAPAANPTAGHGFFFMQ